MNLDNLLSGAIGISRWAGAVLLDVQPKVKEIRKGGKDFLTTADLKADSVIYGELKKLTPEIPIYSEERNPISLSSGEVWVVDPLDGTVNYSHQDVFWGVSIALVKDGQTQLGVVYLPALGCLLAATRLDRSKGGTIYHTKMDIKVSSQDCLARAQLWTDHGKTDDKIVSEMFSRLKAVSLYPQVRVSCSAALLYVASGRVDGFIHPPSPGPEDIAAGCLIVEKAGGKVTDLEGNPWTPLSGSILASNGLLHEPILQAIR